MGFGRGKVILLGEHAVVHGCPAIAVGIERGVSADAKVAERDLLRLAPWDMALRPDPRGSEPLERAFAAALELYPERPALELSAEVELPAGAGLGCSAAIGVAVLDAIDQTLGIERSRTELADAALAWERIFHGNPSGIDNTMSAIGGVALYRKGEPLEPLRSNKPLHLVIGYSGESSSTKEMVASVARQLENDPGRVGKSFEGIGPDGGSRRSYRARPVARLESHDPQLLDAVHQQARRDVSGRTAGRSARRQDDRRWRWRLHVRAGSQARRSATPVRGARARRVRGGGERVIERPMEASARACANIALAKYWGKADVQRNVPAVPSVSLTLDQLLTETRVRFDRSLGADVVRLDGRRATEAEADRVIAMLNRVRREARLRVKARVSSHNHFPTAAASMRAA